MLGSFSHISNENQGKRSFVLQVMGSTLRFPAGNRRVLPTIARRKSRFCYKSLGETRNLRLRLLHCNTNTEEWFRSGATSEQNPAAVRVLETVSLIESIDVSWFCMRLSLRNMWGYRIWWIVLISYASVAALDGPLVGRQEPEGP